MNPFAIAAIASAVVGYLLGSLSFAVIISRLWMKDDVRNHGSGNAGMTNILRTYGKGPAILCTIGDFSKGLLAVLIARWLFAYFGVTLMDGGYVGGLFALLGHLFPLYFGFKGGKGVLTSAGIVLILNPVVVAFLVIPALIIIFLTRIVSVGSLLAAIAYPVVTWLVDTWQGKPPLYDTLFAVLIGGIVVFMHRGNIKRLLNGTENRFGQKKK